eukprot:CAMPEP_0205817322 /NCGR_PEP_ID=MMETSP0205-20121125/24116_1 /ASSEMBLY_ACC=CAM_ASM_000278 /TAXON_ID=36767 /ORGANISM="Euplotes focardii, Strain TN1" /LENGTH=61 /DNA_ID=CAMNT_0053107565 /DNA_START=44 /DNA_END=226 /DNA_ORIENTATION=+
MEDSSKQIKRRSTIKTSRKKKKAKFEDCFSYTFNNDLIGEEDEKQRDEVVIAKLLENLGDD